MTSRGGSMRATWRIWSRSIGWTRRTRSRWRRTWPTTWLGTPTWPTGSLHQICTAGWAGKERGMRRPGVVGGVASAAVFALLLGGCTSGDDGPGKAGQATTTVTVPTGPPAAAAAALGPTGPSTAKACSGVAIAVGADPQQVNGEHPAGTTYCFAKGVHRIAKPIEPRDGDTFGGGPGVVLTGSRALTGWARDGDHWVVRGVLPAAYPLKGQCEDNRSNPCQRGEQVFVDGKQLDRVMTLAELKSGTFFGDYATNAVYLADDPGGRAVELSRTTAAFTSTGERVTVTGLTIEHFASRPQGGALEAGRGWRVTSNEVRWNHAVGVMLIE